MRCQACGTQNPDGMKFCGACGGTLGASAAVSRSEPHRSARHSAERRHITMMFCDVAGSTALAERLDAEDLRDVIHAFQSVCVTAIERFSGHVAKYMGDGLVAYFGYPQAHEDDPRRAVHAGLALLRGVDALNERLGSRYDVELEVRVGIHSGTVVAGEMGSGSTREEFAVVGETPNIAARLEAAAIPGTIAISDATGRLVEGYFDIESRGRQDLKGVSRPIEVLRVIAETGAKDRVDVSKGPSSRLVGRDAELAQMLAHWNRVGRQSGVVAYLSGEAGIGKSRVARAFMEQATDSSSPALVWHCSAYHQTSVLHPVTLFLERWLELEDRPAADRMSALEIAVDSANLDPAEAVPLLASLLSIPTSGRYGPIALAPIEARAATLRILEELVTGNARERPSLLVVEDLHWADPTTLELLTRLRVRVRSLPMMAILTFRPEFEPPWAAADLDLRLAPLSPAAVQEMISAWIGHEPLDAEIARKVAAAADGVPLYVEEMVRMLSAESAEADGAEDRRVAAMAVPATLNGLLTARLDQLGDERTVAQVASVLGRDVHVDLLSSLLDDPADTERAVRNLVDANVLRRAPWLGPNRFEFTHALLQEAAYSSILLRQRKNYHLEAAEVLVTHFAEVADRQPELVAHHFSLASEHRRAVEYWRAAGRRALSGAAFVEATDHFGRGLAELEQLARDAQPVEELIDLLSYLAASRQAGYGYADPPVEALYQRAHELCLKVADVDRLVVVLRGEWMYYVNRAAYSKALEVSKALLGLGDTASDRGVLVEANVNLGLIHMFRGDLAESCGYFERAIELYTEPDQSDQIYQTLGDTRAGAHAYLALVRWALGHIEEAERHSDVSVQLAAASQSPMTIAQAWGMRTMFHLGRKEVDQVGRWCEKAMVYGRERAIPYWQHLASGVHGWFIGRSGDLDAGIDEVERSIDAYRSTGQRLGLPDLQLLLADLKRVSGDVDSALELIARAEQQIDETGECFNLVSVLRSKGELLLACDPPDVAAAERAFVRSVEVARDQGAKMSELRATATLAKFRHRRGVPDTMRSELGRLCDSFPADSDLPDLREARALVDKLAAGAS